MTRRAMQLLRPSKQEQLPSRRMLLRGRNVRSRRLVPVCRFLFPSRFLLPNIIFIPPPSSSVFVQQLYTATAHQLHSNFHRYHVLLFGTNDERNPHRLLSTGNAKSPRFIRKQFKKLRKVTSFQWGVFGLVVCVLVLVLIFGLTVTGTPQ